MADSKKYNGSTWEHSLRKLTTSTDTFTTLPADIYADGNNATVGISGNTVQSGIPTPDNPIMPEGCGDLETVGAKAGQYKIPISSANTTTPVYLGEVETERKIGKIDLSEVSWTMLASGLWITMDIPNIKYVSANTELGGGIAEKYTIHTGAGMISALNCIAIDVSQVSVNTGSDTEMPTGMFWYVLATETTGIVNESLMKIGEYADTVSGISIPTIAGGDTLSVGTTLQPSEVTVNYKGWHRTELKKYAGGVVNKFNKDATNMNNGYLNNRFLLDDNTISTSSLWAVSEYIDISGISTLSAKGVNSTSTRAAICYYNDNKTFISGTSYNGTSEQTFTVPSNAKYCRMSYVKLGSNAMLVEGSTAPSEYHPYYEWVDG